MRIMFTLSGGEKSGKAQTGNALKSKIYIIKVSFSVFTTVCVGTGFHLVIGIETSLLDVSGN